MQNRHQHMDRAFTSTRKFQAAMFAAACAGALGVASSRADQIAYWNFNGSTAPTSTDSHLLGASVGAVGGPTGALASGSGSSDGTQPGQAYALSGAWPSVTSSNMTAGAQFNFNTSNFTITGFNFDWRTSTTCSRYMEWQYTLDGSSWVNGGSFTGAGGDTWSNGNSINLSGISGASNDANFGLRMVSMFSPVAFTQSTAPFTSYAANQAYRAGDFDDRAYAGGTWRFDQVSLLGTYNPVSFSPTNLTWNTSSGNWDTITSNKPWKNPSNVATAFSQNGGQGDVATFSNPAANTIVTIQGAGVTPNSTTVNNSATLTFTGGSIGGTGGLNKIGAGRLIVANSNSFTSSTGSTSITAGVLETQTNNPLGVGTATIGNITWNSTSTTHSAGNSVINLTGPVTFQTDSNLTLSNGINGSGVLTKSGAATLGFGGNSTNTGSIHINSGAVRLDSIGGLGGAAANNTAAPQMDINNATLVMNATGSGQNDSRLSATITLNSATIVRSQLTAGLGAGPTNGDSTLSGYNAANDAFLGGVMIVNGNSTLQNNETRTAAADGSAEDNAMVVRMPVIVTPGSTLNMIAVNNQVSAPGGTPSGNIGNTATALRTADTSVNPNDSLTMQAGSTLVMSGVGEKRIGSSKQGKSIVGLGNSSNEAVIKADTRTYFTDHPDIGNLPTIFVVAGSGTGGLRIEAPMNADYSLPDATTGLFGINPSRSVTPDIIGNNYTVMSLQRYNALDSGGPTQTPDGQAITRGGVLTLAASDVGGAAGTIDNGPASHTPIKLGLDNTAASGAITYQIDAASNSGAFANFGGLVLKNTGANSVTTRLLADTAFNTSGQSLQHLGGTLDTSTHNFSVSVATLSAGNLIGGGTLSSPTIAKTTAGIYSIGPATRINTPALTVSTGTLSVVLDGTDASTSKIGSLSIAGGSAMDINNNDLVLSNSSYGIVAPMIRTARNGGLWNGSGLKSTAALLLTNGVVINKTLGVMTGAQYASLGPGHSAFDGFPVSNTDVLVKFTYMGDANFNGKIDGGDYSRIDTTFALESSQGNIGGWINGDFDLDGRVNGTDYAMIDLAFGSQQGIIPRVLSWMDGSDRDPNTMNTPDLGLILGHYDTFGEPYAMAMLQAVPEPTAVGLVTLSVLCSLARRRRRH